MHALNDLGWPVSLVELAVGTILATGSRAAIYFSGPNAGYEGRAFPGLYDPRTAGEVSPLLNAFEAARSQPLPGLGVDTFPLEFAPASGARDELENLSAVCAATTDPAAVRSALDDLSLSVLHATLAVVPGPLLERTAALAAPHRAGLSADQGTLLAAIEQQAGLGLPLADRAADGESPAPRWPAATCQAVTPSAECARRAGQGRYPGLSRARTRVHAHRSSPDARVTL